MADHSRWNEGQGNSVGESTDGERARARGELPSEGATWRLAQIRKASGVSQVDLAREMSISQKRVSVIENGQIDRLELSTITKYVQALGGRVRVVAQLGDHTIDII